MSLNRIRALACLALLLWLPACASSPVEAARGPGDFIGTWQLAELGGDEVEPPAGDAQAAGFTLTEDGTLSGFGGVNRISGELDPDALVHGRFELGPIISTRMAGPPALMDLEHQFLEVLGQARACAVEGDALVLERDGAVLARLRRAP